MEIETSTVLRLFSVTQAKLDLILASGKKTFPEFWSRYTVEPWTARDLKENSYAYITFLSKEWEDTLPEIRNLLTDSRETFKLGRSMGTEFAIDTSVYPDDYFKEKNELNLTLPADFWNLFLPFQSWFCIYFYLGESGTEEEEIDLEADVKTLEKRWFREEIL